MTRTFVILLMLICISLSSSQSTSIQAQEDDGYLRSDRLGITHISVSTEHTPESRYEQALALGAGWNRWPLYWDRVQVDAEHWDWSAYDRQIREDIAHGLNINLILLGRPEFFADGNRIVGLNEPIYVDGTDTASTDPDNPKELNPANPWVNFVQRAVHRYKPGGLYGALGGIPEDQGIRVWEIWNEPDYSPFWQASIGDYARLLKSAYIVIKQEDPEAQVMFGGLLYPTQNNWLAQVLAIYSGDVQRDQYNWYMDIVAVHNYGDPWRSGWLTLYAKQTLIAYELQRPIWLNETGIPTWSDYPGPTWEPNSIARATLEQQAWFFIQSATFAWAQGADKVFYHQLYDDCGDQPAGTDFPPHNGGLCRIGDGMPACFGDAFGLYRNLSNALCFSQHPQPGSPRPITRAYRLIAEIFGNQPFNQGARVYDEDTRLVTLTFERPLSEERLTVMWNRSTSPADLVWEAVGLNGQLISMDSSTLIAPDGNGNYTITLPAAIEDMDRTSDPLGGMAIGGSPYILIERREGEVEPIVLDLEADVTDIAAINTPRATEPITQPTVDPARDTIPPVAKVMDLPVISAPTFTVYWQGRDNSGIDHYLIWVRIDGGTWLPWIETSDTQSEYTGIPGQSYEFSAWAVDLAGNWTAGTDIIPQASTTVP